MSGGHPARRLSNGDAGGPAAVVSLRGDDHIVVRTEVQSDAGPGVEVVCGGDGSADAVGCADGPVLLEGRGADDGGFVGACGHVDVVCASVAGDGPLLLRAGRGIVGPEGFDDVILNERAGRPAVYG